MKRIKSQERRYVRHVLDGGFSSVANGRYITLLERKFSRLFDIKYAISLMNGTATLQTALAALELESGDEVIVTPLTMSSPSLSIIAQKLSPVFADVELNSFNISPRSIEDNITKKTKAVIGVSLYGLPMDYDPILKICKKNKLYFIEDNAQCFLGRYKGMLAGKFGNFSSFSFQSSKHITSGEGGILLTDDEKLADKARLFSNLGYATVRARRAVTKKTDIQDPSFARHISFGFNFRMSDLQAAVALGQLERAEELTGVRLKVANLFNEVIGQCKWLRAQESQNGVRNSYWCYSVVLETSDPRKQWHRFRNLFVKNGGDGIYAAWRLTYQEPFFQNDVQRYPGIWQKYDRLLCPNAEYLQKRMLQFKTNYWNYSDAQKQAGILRKTIKEFERLYL